MKTFYLILLFLAGFIVGSLLTSHNINENKPKINLPEEYKLIDDQTPIKGYFDKDLVLHIEFDNSIQFKFAGEEKDIPLDEGYLEILGTNENTVYLKNL